jgi:hypothetical protein
MTASAVNFAVNAKADPIKGTTQISLIRDGAVQASVEIDTKQVAAVAGTLLGAARDAFDLSGKPWPYSSEGSLEMTAISCSGLSLGLGSGQTSQSVLLIFHFGETTLGISIPRSEARRFGERLMTLGAEGPPQ